MGFIDNAVSSRIKRISNALHRLCTNDIAEQDLTSSQAYVLAWLAHQQQPVYPSDISKRFGLKHPTVSGILQRLDAKGFICFVPDPDHRRKRILLTEKSRLCDEWLKKRLRQNEQLLLNGMSREEIQTLCVLLDRVIGNINSAAALSDICEKEVSDD